MAGAAKPAAADRHDGPIQKFRATCRRSGSSSRDDMALPAGADRVHRGGLGVVIVVGAYIALADGILSQLTKPLFQR